MLQIKNISKQYQTGDLIQKALDDVSLNFRDNEFVAILGPSGSGKTTLLNIVGGLDRYNSGDLIINGISTKKYKDRDWDAYRNHTIGFVFQSYNLIPHQSVLSNVELALTISGISKAERRKRAKAALEQVGLGDQLHKRPNQMSGGQMQRVAIARALVNNPDILLADEPTGALDSETSVQVMELLKEVARDRLVIMVTHNPELAEEYSTRIVKLKDGKVTADSDPFELDGKEIPAPQHQKMGRTSMSFLTALSLSLNNLRTKKGRTLLTSFAGSIGIIGIALILALSTGIQAYVDSIQRDTLSSYPLSIEKEQSGLLNILTSGPERLEGIERHGEDAVYSNSAMYALFNAAFAGSTEVNNLTAFKEFLDQEMDSQTATTNLREYVSTIQYQYDISLNPYVLDQNGEYHSADMSSLFSSGSNSGDSTGITIPSMMASRMNGLNLWSEMLPGTDGELISDLLYEQYDLVYGAWPAAANEVVLVLDQRNEITDTAFYALGMMERAEVEKILNAVMRAEEIVSESRSASYEDILNISYKLILNTDYYTKGANGIWNYIGDDEASMELVIKNGYDLNIVGILRPKPDAVSTSISGTFGYTAALTEYVIQKTNESELVKAQQASENQNLDLLTGLPFVITEDIDPTASYKAEAIISYFAGLNDIEKTEIYTKILSVPPEGYLEQMVATYMQNFSSREAIVEMIATTYGFNMDAASTYLEPYTDEELNRLLQEQLTILVTEKYAEQAQTQIASLKNSAADPADLFGAKGYAAVAAAFDQMVAAVTDEATLAAYYDAYMPSTVSGSTLADNLTMLGAIDPATPIRVNIYANTFENKEVIADIITAYNESASEEDQISYTDYVALLMSGVTTMINAISYGLIAFVAISLVVSSIMIGIITYISVLERTKEIGILRSIGASKRDISSVFNAETLIVGFCAGAIGIGMSLLLCIPINLIIHALTGNTAINAMLVPMAGLILVLISMTLTLIAGLLPSRMAAKKDPVMALRTE